MSNGFLQPAHLYNLLVLGAFGYLAFVIMRTIFRLRNRSR